MMDNTNYNGMQFLTWTLFYLCRYLLNEELSLIYGILLIRQRDETDLLIPAH